MAAPSRSALTRRDLLKALVATGVGTATGAASFGYAFERHRLGVTRATIDVSGLPEALKGLRIGLVTDTHHSQTVPFADIAQAVELLMAERPDLIVLGGDYVTWKDRRYARLSAEALAPLNAPHGVFAVLGNHDDDREMPAALAARGFEVLKDARTRITVRGEPIEMLGIQYWTRRPADIGRLLRGATAPVFLLAHNPKRLIEAAALDIPLVLSGHTHGGQVVLPVLGAIAAREFPVVAGAGRRGSTTIFVSRGVGTVYLPVRLNCPPEVAVITLNRRADF
jgi:predicted MPP superfamily phosphohydrolase